jgi:hypothetical protein
MGETAALSHSTLLMALSKIEGPVEGNAEGARLPRKQVAEKTSPGASEWKKGCRDSELPTPTVQNAIEIPISIVIFFLPTIIGHNKLNYFVLCLFISHLLLPRAQIMIAAGA